MVRRPGRKSARSAEKLRPAGAALLLAAALLVTALLSTPLGPPILLKSRTITPSLPITGFAIAAPGSQHVLLQLDRIPSDEEKAALEAQGVRLLRYIPERAWLASVDGPLAPAGASYLGPLAPEDKTSPALANGPAFRTADGRARLVVLFHADVPAEAQQPLLERYGTIELLGPPALLEIPESAIRELASEDAVEWVEDAPPPLAVSNDGSRDLIEADLLQAIGLNGTNVTVAEWDSGYANHSDFIARTIIGDPGEGSNHYHSTHVAGTVLGDGAGSAAAGGSAFQWRGMAPNATLATYEWPDSGGSEAIDEANHSIVNYGAVLSQNSWGYLITSSVCSLLGDYDSFARTYDLITAGIGMEPQTVVFSAGNERSKTACGQSTVLYNTSAGPGAMAKNVITVGAVDKAGGMSSFSSWGPSDDGRIKPEVVAVGVNVKSTNTNTGYTTLSGTSMSSPAVTGALALVHEAYKAAHAGNDQNVATDKALLIHTAVDQNNTGPDYSTGFGLVNATKAVAKARADRNSSGLIVQGSLSNNENATYSLNVSAGQPFLNITLAWNDYPGTAGAAVTLVNNLDLIVLNSSGTRSYPWTLDKNQPGLAAARNQTDSINPQEQVRIDSPPAGSYTIVVSGVSVPQAPQNFTLVLDDTQPPQWANLTVNVTNNSAFTAGAHQFNATWSDDSLLDFVLFELDGANNTVQGGITQAGTSTYQFNASSLAGGTHSYRWYANDTSGNWNSTENLSYGVVPQATATTLRFNGTESNLTLSTTDAVNATATTNVTGLTVALSWNATGYGDNFTNSTTSVTNISSTSSLGAGYFNITAATVATANYSASSVTRFLTIAGSPQISLSGPTNGSALAAGTLINLTIATDSPNLTVYNNGTANSTLVSPYRINTSGWSDGTTTVTVWAADTLGNVGSAVFRFVLDSVAPSLTLFLPQNATYSNSSIPISFFASDPILNTTRYSLNGTANATASNTTLALPDGFHNLSLWALDNASNANGTAVFFTVDTTSPAVSAARNSSLVLAGENVTVDANASDSHLAQVTVNLSNSTQALLTNMTFLSGDSYQANLSTASLAVGSYNLTVLANDTFNHTNSSSGFLTIGAPRSTNLSFVASSGALQNVTWKLLYNSTQQVRNQSTSALNASVPSGLWDLNVTSNATNQSYNLTFLNLNLTDDLSANVTLDADINATGLAVPTGVRYFIRVLAATSGANFSSARLLLAYNGSNVSRIDRLNVYACHSWNGTACTGSWENATENASIDITNNRTRISTPRLSAFGLAETTVCGDGTVDPGETTSTCCDDTGCSSGQSCTAHACVAQSSSSSSSSGGGGGGGGASTPQNRTNATAASNATNATAQNTTAQNATNATANQTANATDTSSGLGTPAGQFYNPPQEQPPLWALAPLAALLIAAALYALRGRLFSKKSLARKLRP